MSNEAEQTPEPPLLAIVGPTAAGKTALSILVARRLDAEIVSMDSMLVYRGMDVGTAKPAEEERGGVPHHLLDLVEPHETFDLQRWLAAARDAERDIVSRGRRALFVGGTGLYLKALVFGVFDGPPVDPKLRASIEARGSAEGGREELFEELRSIDPEAVERLHPNDTRRVVRALEVHAQTGRTLSDWQREWRGGPGRPRRLVGIDVERQELVRRIEARTRAMLSAGWLEEAAHIRAEGGFSRSSRQALGYDIALRCVDGELSQDEAAEEIALRTRQFARRQRTWFRHFPDIRWVEGLPSGDGASQSLERAVVEVVGALTSR